MATFGIRRGFFFSWSILLLGLLGLLGTAAPAEAAPPRQTPLSIVTTTAMIGDVAHRIAGERGAVTALIGAGVDPHLYKATRSDTARMLSADVIFYNGLLLEGKMTDALIRIASSGRPVFAVTDLLDEELLLPQEDFEGHNDPHVWMDPVAWASTVDVIAAKLSKIDPPGASIYAANAAAYKQELERLHAYAEEAFSTIPEPARVLVTAHDAFHYLSRRYGLEVHGVQGISTESEAGLRDIERLVRLLVDRRVPAVFAETTVADRNVRALIEGARARGVTVRLGEELFSDAMGPPGTYEGTYIGMIDHNITAITLALGGQAPAGGMNGKLCGAH